MKQKHPTLDQLLAKARNYTMTPAEREAQRKSWVIGELMLSNPKLTRAEAEARYNRAKESL